MTHFIYFLFVIFNLLIYQRLFYHFITSFFQKLKFEICPSSYEENLDQRKHTFSDFVEKTALGKLNDVYEKLKNDTRKPDLIIAVDTMVTYNGRMYGKPKSKEDAFNTIKE